MIVVLKHGVEAAKREQLIDWLEGQGLTFPRANIRPCSASSATRPAWIWI